MTVGAKIPSSDSSPREYHCPVCGIAFMLDPPDLDYYCPFCTSRRRPTRHGGARLNIERITLAKPLAARVARRAASDGYGYGMSASRSSIREL